MTNFNSYEYLGYYYKTEFYQTVVINQCVHAIRLDL